MFPTPLEVDRFLYKVNMIKTTVTNEFPAPLEVDRFLYSKRSKSTVS